MKQIISLHSVCAFSSPGRIPVRGGEVKHLVAAFFSLIFFAGPASANQITLEFNDDLGGPSLVEDLPEGMTIAVDSPSVFADGLLINSGYLTLYGANYSSNRVAGDFSVTDGRPFNLLSLDILPNDPGTLFSCRLNFGDLCEQITVIGFDDQGAEIASQVFAAGERAWESLVFGPAWQGIYSFKLISQAGFESAEIGVDNVSISVVPVPAAVWLFGSALAGMGWLRRKQAA